MTGGFERQVKILRNILLSFLIAALSFLAVWILTLNFDVTWHSFEHQEVARRVALRLACLIATGGASIAFLVALCLLESRRRTKLSHEV